MLGALSGLMFGFLIFIFISIYPFYLQRQATPLVGFWKTVGDIYQTPQNAFKLIVGMSVALVVVLSFLIQNVGDEPRCAFRPS